MDASPPTMLIATAEMIKEEFITQMIKAWLAKSTLTSLSEGLGQFCSLSTNSNPSPTPEPRILIPEGRLCRFISLDDHPITDIQLKLRAERLHRWTLNPANHAILQQVNTLLRRDIDDNIWWLAAGEKNCTANMDLLDMVSH
jgi:hypothetical protein